jgi:hypothetical protein
MPRPTKNDLDRWGALLKAARKRECELGGIAPFIEALSATRDQALNFKGLRDSLRASAADAHRRYMEALAEGNDAAISLRAYLVSTLGPRNPQLREFGMNPLKIRRRPPTDGASGKRKGVKKAA